MIYPQLRCRTRETYRLRPAAVGRVIRIARVLLFNRNHTLDQHIALIGRLNGAIFH